MADAPYHYNYQRLDNFLSKDTDPQEIGNELDEIMGDVDRLSRGRISDNVADPAADDGDQDED